MPRKFLQSSLLAIALSLTLNVAHAESQPFIPLPDQLSESTERFPLVDPNNLPFSDEARKDYAVSLDGGRGVLISPNWVLTASHVITRKKENNPKSIKMRFKGKGKKSYPALKVYRHPAKDLALVQLLRPIFEKREPVILMRDAIERGERVTVKKVSEGERFVWKNLPARGARKGNLFISKGSREGGPGTSGSPWLVESPLVGDVVVGITRGGGVAPQVALAKGWIQSVVAENTPGEFIYWATKEQVFAEPQGLAEAAATPKPASTLLVLP